MAGEAVVFSFRLYVTGQTECSQMAEANLRAICDNHLRGHYKLEVVDALERPDMAETERILATPTVIRLAPLPEWRVIGDCLITIASLHEIGTALEGLLNAETPMVPKQRTEADCEDWPGIWTDSGEQKWLNRLAKRRCWRFS